MVVSQAKEEASGPVGLAGIVRWVLLLILVYVLIAAVSIIGRGFQAALGDEARSLFAFSENPFVGLMVGIVATALIQSSTAVTAIIVALVAGGLPVPIAVPMIMGSNMGTTLTSSIVSLGQVAEPEDFRRAYAAATIHDGFNLLSILIFFPLELLFHPLQKLSLLSANLLVGGADVSMSDLNFMGLITRPVVNTVRETVAGFSTVTGGVVLILVGLVLIVGSVYFVGKLMKQLMVGRARELLNMALGQGLLWGIAAGTLITVIVQSSTTTTSLIVPLAGAGVVTLWQVYPFTLGANIGTTLTAILAATAISGDMAVPAMQIAFVHFYFSVLGVVVVLAIPFLRKLPVLFAQWIADLATKRKIYAAVYLLSVFVVIPLLCVLGSVKF